MEYILIGKYINTHGIKGEIRIDSNFKYKELVFIKRMNIYIGKQKNKFVIQTHRVHKNYNMVTLDGITDINEIEMLKGSYIYINKADIDLSDKLLLSDDLINYDVYIDNKLLGKVLEIIKGKANEVLVVSEKRILIPYVDEFIININAMERKILVKNVKGLIE